jgi:two-component system, chemotaxis family, chemotaxis protein CheY
MESDANPEPVAVGAIGRTLLRRAGHCGPILIAEDEAPLQQAMAVALRTKGYRVVCGSNGSEALRLTETDLPSLVILDLQMPVLDGWGFIRTLRRRGYEVPILLITGGIEAESTADEMGAVGYLDKPFRLGQLLHAVSRLVPVPDAPNGLPVNGSSARPYLTHGPKAS